jgi:hypothetical protein
MLEEPLVPVDMLLQKMRKRNKRQFNQSLVNHVDKYRYDASLHEFIRLLQKELDKDDQRCIW